MYSIGRQTLGSSNVFGTVRVFWSHMRSSQCPQTVWDCVKRVHLESYPELDSQSVFGNCSINLGKRFTVSKPQFLFEQVGSMLLIS